MSRALASVRVVIDGMVAVHAARAAHTALGAIPEITSAQVTMAGAVLDVHRPVNVDALTASLREVLAPLGLGVVSVHVMQDRALPLA